MQHIEPPAARPLLPDYDAHMTGTGIYPPPSILLDYTYGVAAYQRWHGGQDIDQMMKDRFAEKYKDIPPLPPPEPSQESEVESGPEDPHDGDYQYKPQRSGKHRRSSTSDGRLRAMDDVLALSRLMKGITTEEIAAKRQRREEEDERRAQKEGRERAEQWRKETATPASTDTHPPASETPPPHETNDLGGLIRPPLDTAPLLLPKLDSDLTQRWDL
jgi:hypothetical protein